MVQQGLPVNEIKQRLAALADSLKQADFETPVAALKEDPLLKAWQVFRQQSVTQLVENYCLMPNKLRVVLRYGLIYGHQLIVGS